MTPQPLLSPGSRPAACHWLRLAAALPMTLLVVACGRSEGAAPDQPAAAPPPAPHVEAVETVITSVGEVDASLIASGTVIAPRTTLLSSEVAGRIASVRVDEGDQLRAGDVAFVIEPDPYEISLEEAKAGLQLARAQAAQEEQELERTRSLAEQQIVAAQELDFRRTQLAVAQARVSQALAQLHRAERNLERTVVRAPYDSTVVERHLHEGANVAGPATVVLTLQALAGFEAQLAIPEASTVNAKVGDPVSLQIQGLPDAIPTTVLSVNPRIDPESRTYSLRASIPASQPAKAGAFVRATVTPVATRTGLVLPRSAVLRRDGVSMVFRYGEGRAELVPVQLGATGLERVEILSGLDEGDEVIVGNLIDRIADGTPVERRGQPRPSTPLLRPEAPPAVAAEPPPSAPPSASPDLGATARAEASTSARTGRTSPYPGVRQIRVVQAPTSTEVLVDTHAPMLEESVVGQRLAGGSPRYVLRLGGIDTPYFAAPIVARTSELERVRTGHHPESRELHVVLDLAQSELDVAHELTGSGVRLVIQQRNGSEATR